LRNLLVKWIVNSTALLVVVHLVPSIVIDDWPTVFVAAVVLGLLNSFLRPVLIMLTLPVTILSLGIFTLFINAFLFYLVSKLVSGFHVGSFSQAFLGAFIFSLVSFFLSIFISSEKR